MPKESAKVGDTPRFKPKPSILLTRLRVNSSSLLGKPCILPSKLRGRLYSSGKPWVEDSRLNLPGDESRLASGQRCRWTSVTVYVYGYVCGGRGDGLDTVEMCSRVKYTYNSGEVNAQLSDISKATSTYWEISV